MDDSQKNLIGRRFSSAPEFNPFANSELYDNIKNSRELQEFNNSKLNRDSFNFNMNSTYNNIKHFKNKKYFQTIDNVGDGNEQYVNNIIRASIT